MRGVRLYGMDRTNTSWGRVTAGVREGLEYLEALAGFVPVDRAPDDEDVFPGVDAPTALYVGPPSGVAMMTSYGEHRRRFAILAPNSDWLPKALIEQMSQYTELVAPSTWGAKVIERHTGRYIEPYLHGVSAAFYPDPRARQAVASVYPSFYVLHLASTPRQRKGTAELVAAWKQAVAKEALGPDPRLEIIVDAPEGTFGEGYAAMRDHGIYFPLRQLNAPIDKMRKLMQGFHLVCQPSRAEGFGLTPLEARASGVPVCTTDCTGHADHVINGDPGAVVIATGEPMPVDDAPEGEVSLAPSLDVDEIEGALVESFQRWPALHKQAMEHADALRAEWSWHRTTEDWLKKMEITWT